MTLQTTAENFNIVRAAQKWRFAVFWWFS